jgi:hypothetical protein
MPVNISKVRLQHNCNKRYVDELFLLLSAAICLLRVLTLYFDVFALKAAQRRHVAPDAYPTRDLLSGVRGKLWLEIVYNLYLTVSVLNGLLKHTY